MFEQPTFPVDRTAPENAPVDSSQGITPLPLGGEQPRVSDYKDISDRAKAFEPACRSILKIVDSASYRAALRLVSPVIKDKKQAATMAETVRFDDEVKPEMAKAGARIFARHCKSDEAADWTVVAGGIADLAGGWYVLADEIKKLREAQEVANAKTK